MNAHVARHGTGVQVDLSTCVAMRAKCCTATTSPFVRLRNSYCCGLVTFLVVVFNLTIQLECVVVGIIGIDVIVIKHAVLIGDAAIATSGSRHYGYHGAPP